MSTSILDEKCEKRSRVWIPNIIFLIDEQHLDDLDLLLWGVATDSGSPYEKYVYSSVLLVYFF